MGKRAAVRTVFGVGALYDGALGLGFLVAGPALFDAVGLTPPDHWGFVQFGACLLVVFGLMFARVAQRPEGRRELMVYGVLLKASYIGVVAWHMAGGAVPEVWVVLAAADVAFLAAFVWAIGVTGGGRAGVAV